MHIDKKLVIFVFSILSQFNSKSFYNSSLHSYCNGALCTKNCSNCNLCIQEENCFIKENCYCPSVSIPGNLSLEDTPQFIFFTFDDAIPFDFFNKADFLRDLFQNPQIKDSNGCFLRPTFYAQSKFNDFGMAAWFEKIGEISLHTTTHKTSKFTTKDVWIKEFGTVGNNMRYLGDVHEIRGARAPYLQFNDDYFDALKFLNLAYDSSGTFNFKWDNYNLPASEQKNYWPFTLDFGFPRKSMCEVGVCPSKTHPGVWEFLMNGWMRGSFEQIIMDYIINENSLYDFIKDFDDNYNRNRAPLGFFFHVAWFEDLECLFDKTKKKFLIDLFSYIASKPNVLFATPYRVIQWMKNPKSISETLVMKEFQCVNETIKFGNSCSDGKNLKQCCFPLSHFFVCGDYCPDLYPDLDANWQFLGSNETIDHSIYLINNLDEQSNQNFTNQTNNTQENKSISNETKNNTINDSYQNDSNADNNNNNTKNESIRNDTNENFNSSFNETTKNDTKNNNSIDNNFQNITNSSNNTNKSINNDNETNFNNYKENLTNEANINDTTNNTINETYKNDTNITNGNNKNTNQSRNETKNNDSEYENFENNSNRTINYTNESRDNNNKTYFDNSEDNLTNKTNKINDTQNTTTGNHNNTNISTQDENISNSSEKNQTKINESQNNTNNEAFFNNKTSNETFKNSNESINLDKNDTQNANYTNETQQDIRRILLQSTKKIF